MDRRALVWLSLYEKGETAAKIASEAGMTIRHVRRELARAKDLLEHLREQVAQADPDNAERIRFLAWDWSNQCVHGLPGLEDGTWLCLRNHNHTNNPGHPKFRRGRINRDPKPDDELSPREIAESVQPDGPAKFKPHSKGAKT